MWSKKEAIFIIFACLICTGALITGAISDAINGGSLFLSAVAVVLSAVNISIALYLFDDFIAQLEDK